MSEKSVSEGAPDESTYGTQKGSPQRPRPLRSSRASAHYRLTGAQVIGLTLDERALDRRGYRTQPRPVASVCEDLLFGGPRPAATEQRGSQVAESLRRCPRPSTAAGVRARNHCRLHSAILTRSLRMRNHCAYASLTVRGAVSGCGPP